jgi:histidinol-phosphate aminotransferase
MGLATMKPFAAPANCLFEWDTIDQPIRLSSNENPYGPSPLARKAMMEHITVSNRYNWQLTGKLVDAIAVNNNIGAGNILLGAGSTELIDLAGRFSAQKKGSLVIADPSYAYWTEATQKAGLRTIPVPLTINRTLDLDAMLQAIEPDTKLVYVCNPNNPTGTICERFKLVPFINEATKKALVLVDEAYLDFTDQQSVCTLAVENENLIVVKTFSKIYGLAGARIGYAIGNTKTMEQISALQSWVNGSISVSSAAAALAALKDEKFVADTYSINEKTRKYTIDQLEQRNLVCIPSASNFVYFSLTNYKKDYFQQLQLHNITGTKIYEENGQWTRITVGTMPEMQQFIRAIG